MKAVITYDVAGTVEIATAEGPYIRAQLFADGRLWVKVYAERGGNQLRCLMYGLAYSIDIDIDIDDSGPAST